MNLYQKILTIYPQLISTDFIGSIRIQDDGGGAYIAQWNHELPQPTQQELDAITGDYVKLVTEITKLQFVEWCEANNKLTDLLNLLNSDATLMFKWDAATSLDIGNPLVIGAAAALSLDAQAVFNEIGG